MKWHNFAFFFQRWGEGLHYFGSLLKNPWALWQERQAIWTQVYLIGFQSLPLIFITALATGMVMTLQFGVGLSRFGGAPYVPRLITVSVLREMGPVFTSLMLAARIAAGMAAEIGSMVVTQQVDALSALGSSPYRKIVLPRLMGALIAVPLACALSTMVALLGVALVSHFQLGIDMGFVIAKMGEGFTFNNFASGFFKTLFFSMFIAVPACLFGLNVTEGTREVGRATTQAVVTASVLILVGDFILTKLYMVVFE